MSGDAHQTFPPRLIGLLVVLTLTWGFNWPMIKLAITGMAPMHFRTLCLIVGASGTLRDGGRRPHRMAGAARGVAAARPDLVLQPHRLEHPGGLRRGHDGFRTRIDPRLHDAGVERAAAIWFLGERFTGRRAVGVALGMAGMGLLLSERDPALQRAPLGALLMIGAAISWAIGLVLIRKWAAKRPATSYSAWQMLVGVVPILAIALFAEDGSFNPFVLPPAATIGVFYNLLVAFIFCHWAWMKIAQSTPAGVSSLASLMVPVVGVFSGALVLGETPRWTDYAALLLVVGSLATVLIPPRRP